MAQRLTSSKNLAVYAACSDQAKRKILQTNRLIGCSGSTVSKITTSPIFWTGSNRMDIPGWLHGRCANTTAVRNPFHLPFLQVNLNYKLKFAILTFHTFLHMQGVRSERIQKNSDHSLPFSQSFGVRRVRT